MRKMKPSTQHEILVRTEPNAVRADEYLQKLNLITTTAEDLREHGRKLRRWQVVDDGEIIFFSRMSNFQAEREGLGQIGELVPFSNLNLDYYGHESNEIPDPPYVDGVMHIGQFRADFYVTFTQRLNTDDLRFLQRVEDAAANAEVITMLD